MTDVYKWTKIVKEYINESSDVDDAWLNYDSEGEEFWEDMEMIALDFEHMSRLAKADYWRNQWDSKDPQAKAKIELLKKYIEATKKVMGFDDD